MNTGIRLQQLAMAMTHLKQICARQGTVRQQQGLTQVPHGGLLQTDPLHAVLRHWRSFTYSGMVGVRSAALVQTSADVCLLVDQQI